MFRSFVFVAFLGAASLAKAAADDNGMVVTKDPATGKLRPPTAAEAAQLNKTAKRPVQARKPTHKTITGPDGAKGIVLDESSTIFAVATKTPDGKVNIKETTKGGSNAQ